jgi:hypothetical protein
MYILGLGGLLPRSVAIILSLGLAACATTTPRPAAPRAKAPLVPTAASRPAASRPVLRPPAYPRHRIFASAADALDEILSTSPRVIGFGEYHQKTDSAKVMSPLKRFTTQMLDHLAERVSDLVVELAMPVGECKGGKENRVAKKVEKTTKRPKATENEAALLLGRARRLGIRPHILLLSCAEYSQLLGGEDVDYEKLLTMLTVKLADKAREALSRPVRFNADGELRNLVLLYGGALHNDIVPQKYLTEYSYAAQLTKLSKGRFVEVDLYVPEYIEGDATMSKERWYPLRKHAARDHVVLIERGARSYILLLQSGAVVP